MATSCSHWWHCPFYFGMSVTLVAIAISASIHPKPHNPNPLIQPTTHSLSRNATLALRNQGFNAIATLLQIYPESFLSSPQSTIFAIKDPVIFNLSAHPRALKQLLKYHTSPLKLPIQELLKKPQNACLPTLVPRKNIAITKIDARQGSIEINGALVSHPDLFLQGSISIHGVLGPFCSLDVIHEIDQDWEIAEPPICDPNYRATSDGAREIKNTVEWARVVRLLASERFVSFSIGLHSVLDGVLQDYPDLDSVTVFAPLEFVFVASPWRVLDSVVRFHLLPRRLAYAELASLPEKATLRTLVPDRNLVITTAYGHSNRGLAINGVEIIAENSISAPNIVIHGISRAFSMEESPSTSI